ncbi:MAG: hypothetical protein Q4G05_03965 [Clostridia bacterium]|nr:hypothetical protein [Clostridia bacterium]
MGKRIALKNSYKIVSTCNHTMFIIDGNLYGCGRNKYGQLGDGTRIDRKLPVQIMPEIKFKEVSVGLFNSMFIDIEGNLYSCGRNEYGELGDGTETYTRKLPIQIMPGTKFKHVSVGISSTMFIDIEGNLYGCGKNIYGQLGDGTTTRRIELPIQIMPEIKFKDVSVGAFHSMFIDIEGNLYGCGSNDYGQLGDGTTIQRNVPVQIMPGAKFKYVTAGRDSTMFIDIERNLYGCGSNEYGQLGDGTIFDRKRPVQIIPETKFKYVTAGHDNTMFIDIDGNLYGCGDNSYGQLGDGTDNDWIPIPIQIMYDRKYIYLDNNQEKLEDQCSKEDNKEKKAPKEDNLMEDQENFLKLIEETIKSIKEIKDYHYNSTLNDILKDKVLEEDVKKEKELNKQLGEFCEGLQENMEDYLNSLNNNYSFSEKVRQKSLKELYCNLTNRVNELKKLEFNELLTDIINEKLEPIFKLVNNENDRK